jgi:hypothetical protein
MYTIFYAYQMLLLLSCFPALNPNLQPYEIYYIPVLFRYVDFWVPNQVGNDTITA